MNQIWLYGLRFLFVLPAIILHEVSHGYVAYLLGDPTAKQAKRLSLNPIRHIDPFGTLLLPALLLLVSGGTFSFGYAKPVPIQPAYFRNYRLGMFLTGIAGPTTNFVLAVISGLIVRAIGEPTLWAVVLFYFAEVNLVLMFFNLIPIPPLDGSRIIPLFLSDRGLRTYHRVEQYGFGIIMLLIWGIPALFRIDPIGIYFRFTVDPIINFIVGS